MKRRFKDFFSISTLKQLIYIPLIIIKVNNWLVFLLNYSGFRGSSTTYTFRNGLQVKTGDPVDTATISVIFIKRDYGKIKEKVIIIDIGANIGTFSLYAASSTDNTIIYAYEPMPENYQLLSENIKANKLEDRIIPYNLGVAASNGDRKLYISGRSPFYSMHTKAESDQFINIRCISLQEVFKSNKINECGLLKIDCEGAEFEILYNTPDSYFQRIKEIKLEYHNQKDIKENHIDVLLKFLKEKGFQLDKLRRDSNFSGIAWLVSEDRRLKT